MNSSSFLFEKQQIDCACFEGSSQNVRRIFRSESQHSPYTGSKSIKEASVQNQTFKTKHKKKSLKKQTPFQAIFSQNNHQQKQQIIQETFIGAFQNKHARKQQRFQAYEQRQTVISQECKKSGTRLSQKHMTTNYPVSFISQQLICNNPNKAQNYTHSQQQITPVFNEQYQKLVQQEFRKDFEEFTIQIEIKKIQKKLDQFQGKAKLQRGSQQKTIPNLKIQKKNPKSKKIKSVQFLQNQVNSLEKIFINKENNKIQQTLERNKDVFNKADSLPQIPKQKLFQKSLHNFKQPFARKQRKQSFRNSMICFKEKQQKAKKLKSKMYAKQIESEKDSNSSNESDNISEVVGRGWDGLTEQKVEIEQLDEMMKNQNGNSQTMVTQQSHIKNSQIKTFTDYSNSFISPKSHYARPMQTSIAFGGGKSGTVGLSYQNFQDLRKLKQPTSGQLNF